jgi:hypothetical protein
MTSRRGYQATGMALLLLALLAPSLAMVTHPLVAAAAGNPCTAPVQAVACENSKPGNPSSEWDVNNGGDTSIQGFATDISVNIGQAVRFKVNTVAASYHVDLYRIGYYQGLGARKIGTATVTAALPQTQPACLTDPVTILVDCGNWAESASWTVPSDAVSGVYVAHLVRDDTGGDSQIPFVVRDDARHSAVIFQTSDTTWQAYNDWGGNSLYTATGGGRAYKVSYNRPIVSRADTPDGRDFFFGTEYPAVRWLEANGYDVAYQSGIDTDRGGSLLVNHLTFLSVGHDEYWSGNQRANVEAARSAGVNLAFLSGNEVYWKTRWEPSIDASATPYRTLVTYKETKANAKIDPNPAWTGTWRDPRFSPPSDGGRPENALTGTAFSVQNSLDSIEVPESDGKLRLWANTDIATQAPGGVVTLPLGTLGYEWDEDPDNGSRPAGLFDLSSTTRTVTGKLLDYGSTVGTGTATHHLTMYRAPSGALVFSAGTIQWTWGLDDHHDGVGQPPDLRMQQATVNLLADMGAQPATLNPSLVAATATTDTTPPIATITSPTAGATLTNGSSLTVTGTATDTGGRVASVEVSTDGGTTWHRAIGRGSWSYATSVTGIGARTVNARAVDDSGNIQPAPTSVSITSSCPCSIFGLTATPTTPATTDANPVEVGVKFQSDIDGWVTGVRFYKGTGNTGSHTGSLWTTSGQELATATFTSESASGWQQADFGAPIAITAGTTYVVSYRAPTGHYAADSAYFATSATTNAPLHGLANGANGGNGVFVYGGHGFPVNSYGSTNYWVDAVLSTIAPPDTVPPTVSSRTPLPGSSSNPTSTKPTATFTEAVQAATISFTVTDTNANPIAGATSWNGSTRTATFTPTATLPAGMTLTATVSGALDLVGNAMTAPSQWSFTTAGATPPPGVCPCSIWNDSATPAVATVNDARGIELGVRFTSDTDGTITGVRFYKGPSNTGTHTGTLWSSTGTALATATFSSESTSGWQTVTFAAPVALTAGTAYVASYHTNVGYYSATSGAFSSGKKVDNAPLHAPTNATGAPNGAYVYGTGGFPVNGNGANYWVDVVFVAGADTSPPSVVGRAPEIGATSVAISTLVKATMSEPIQPGATLALTGPGSTPVTGTTTYDAVAHQLIFTPAAVLAASTTFTATVAGSVDLAGNPMTAPVIWSFTTAGPTACPCSLWSTDTLPATAASTDPKETELGVRLSPDTAGWVSGIRFYKGTGNTGVHTGSLWTAGGALLATATFSGESATGWQQVLFPAPIHLTAGQTYIASYHAPSGHYAADKSYFASALDNAPLHAPANTAGAPNGVYLYGPTGFPTSTYQSTNYWVDVAFSTTAPPDVVAPQVNSVTPVDASTSVPPGSTLQATFSEAIDPTSLAMALTGPSGAVAGTTTYDTVTHRATFTPTAALADLSAYTASVTTARDLAGNSLPAPVSWTFHTAEPTAAIGTCPCLIWPDAVGPAQPSTTDSQSIEVGTKFRADTSGWLTGVRFYKGSTNAGIHTATLWDSTGSALATGTFTSESAAGWQQLSFPSAVAITAGTTYVASYHAPTGHYAATVGAFAAAGVDRGMLHALRSGFDGPNGVFAYGPSTFPTTGADTNYWVQPVYDSVPERIPPVSSSIASVGTGTTATVTWTTDEPSTSTVSYGTSAGALTLTANTPGLTTSHSVNLSGLTPNTGYYFRVGSTDQWGNSGTSPAPPSAPAVYLPVTVPFVDTTAADFGAGTNSGTSVLAADDGEVGLTPTVGEDFSGPTLPAGWTSTPWTPGGAAAVSGGSMTLDGTAVGTTATYARGRSLEFVATFAGAANESAGFGVGFQAGEPRAVFTNDIGGNALYAVTGLVGSSTRTKLTTVSPKARHRFRIDWTSTGVVYTVDGLVVASHTTSPASALRPLFSDLPLGLPSLVTVDWVRMSPFAASGTFTSRVLDAGAQITCGAVSWNAELPAGTTTVVLVRSGNTATPDLSWSAWTTVAGSGATPALGGRYLQYQIQFTSTGSKVSTARLNDITIGYSAKVT